MFFVYILRCRDGSLYTGITNDLEKRMETHSRGKGSRYVRSRLPFKLVHSEPFDTKPKAMRRENEIKMMKREEKAALIKGVY
jgi:putative endonuclease